MRSILALVDCLLLACGTQPDHVAPSVGNPAAARIGPEGPLGALLARPGLQDVQIELAFLGPGKTLAHRVRTLKSPTDIAACRAVLEAARVERNPLKWETKDRSGITCHFANDESATIDVYYPCRYLSVGSGQSRVYYEVDEIKLRQLCGPLSGP